LEEIYIRGYRVGELKCLLLAVFRVEKRFISESRVRLYGTELELFRGINGKNELILNYTTSDPFEEFHAELIMPE